MSALAHSIASESQAEGETPGSTGNVELENQFILRLPTEPSKALREALRSGAGNIKERLSIQLEPEKGTSDPRLRKGIVEFDGWNMSAKVVDLPTIIESQKTIDRKTFYKTADISQIVICKEGEPSDEEDNPTLNNGKKYDPNKVDKKYLYRHGICPPLKNCRKRRFRKTMKKKYIEAPEIEKEVRRLFRVDEEAVSVKWELIDEEEVSFGRQKYNHKDKNSKIGGKSAHLDAHDKSTNLCDEKDIFGALTDTDEDSTDESEEDEDCTQNVDERDEDKNGLSYNLATINLATIEARHDDSSRATLVRTAGYSEEESYPDYEIDSDVTRKDNIPT